MLKKKFALIFFLLLSSCGYEAIYSKKNIINYNFSISNLTLMGEKDINLKIKEKLYNYTLNKKDKNFILTISSNMKKVAIAKNISGNPTKFKSTIIIDIEVLMEGNLKNNLQIIESLNYSNIDNKFDLKKYEQQIKYNLAEVATEKLIFKLSNIQ
ncbi:hypothetical protein OAS09_00540 [Candidatus Pelagibacter ubique]|jgi:hypothetical protein|nr:hypothetical protein [Candidatus Pelagibacter ubique]